MIEKDDNRDDLEDLMARSLWGELTPEQKEELEARLFLHEKERDDLNSFHAMDDLFLEANLSLEDFSSVKTLKDELKSVRASRKKTDSPFLSFRPLIGAAASILFIFGISIAYFDYRRGHTDQVILSEFNYQATVSFVENSCFSGNSLLKMASPVPDSGIAASADSFCDVQIENGGSTVIRIYPRSSISVKSIRGSLFIVLHAGEIIVDSLKKSPDEKVAILSRGKLFRLLGTKVYLKNSRDKELLMDVLEGRVQVTSGNAYHFEDIALQPLTFLSDLGPEYSLLMQETVQIINSGERISFMLEETTVRQSPLDRLRQSVSQKEKDISSGELSEKDIKAVIVRWQKSLSGDEIAALFEKYPPAPVENLNQKNRLRLEKRFLTLQRTSRDNFSANNFKALAKDEVKKILKDYLLKEKSIGDEMMQKLILKDGREILGLVRQTDEGYEIFTVKWSEIFSKEEVDRIEWL